MRHINWDDLLLVELIETYDIGFYSLAGLYEGDEKCYRIYQYVGNDTHHYSITSGMTLLQITDLLEVAKWRRSEHDRALNLLERCYGLECAKR